jgi:hypothetical protein
MYFYAEQIDNNSKIGNTTDQIGQQLDDIVFYLNLCEKILQIYPVVLLPIGFIGNILAFLVLMYGSRKKSTTFAYLACLALIDLAVIVLFCLNFITFYHFNIDLQAKSAAFCKIYAFLIYYLPQYSAWTLSIVSIDRMLALGLRKFQTKTRKHSTYTDNAQQNDNNAKTKARIVCKFFQLKINLTFWRKPCATKATKSSKKRKTNCFSNVFYSELSEKYRPFLMVLLIGIFLFLLNSHFLFMSYNSINMQSNNITVRNYSRTIDMLHKSDRLDRHTLSILIDDINVIQCSLEHDTDFEFFYKLWVHVDSVVNVYLPFIVMSLSSIVIVMLVVRSMKAARNYNCGKVARNISIMLVSLNTMFILLTAPIVILLSIDANYSQSESIYDTSETTSLTELNANILSVSKKRLLKVICIIIMNSNHACNIMVYCLIGSEFRRHFICAMRRVLFGDSKYRTVYSNNATTMRRANVQKRRETTTNKRYDDMDYDDYDDSGRKRSQNLSV